MLQSVCAALSTDLRAVQALVQQLHRALISAKHKQKEYVTTICLFVDRLLLVTDLTTQCNVACVRVELGLLCCTELKCC